MICFLYVQRHLSWNRPGPQGDLAGWFSKEEAKELLPGHPGRASGPRGGWARGQCTCPLKLASDVMAPPFCGSLLHSSDRGPAGSRQALPVLGKKLGTDPGERQRERLGPGSPTALGSSWWTACCERPAKLLPLRAPRLEAKGLLPRRTWCFCPSQPATPVCSSGTPRAPHTASQRSHKAAGRRRRNTGTRRPSHTARRPPGASRLPYAGPEWVSDEALSASGQIPG